MDFKPVRLLLSQTQNLSFGSKFGTQKADELAYCVNYSVASVLCLEMCVLEGAIVRALNTHACVAETYGAGEQNNVSQWVTTLWNDPHLYDC